MKNKNHSRNVSESNAAEEILLPLLPLHLLLLPHLAALPRLPRCTLRVYTSQLPHVEVHCATPRAKTCLYTLKR